MAMLRAARAMAMATRVVGNEEDEGVEEGNESYILNWKKMF